MISWAKYAVSFFALVLVLSALIYVFAPRGDTVSATSQNSVGQLPSNHEQISSGQPANQ